MLKNNLQKLKKYLFLISLFVFGILLAHLIYNYIYYDAKNVPIKWGTLSEWIVWEIPALNPLVTWNDQNKYITSLLYRSLLKYDIKEKKIVSDLANCDISNLTRIECYLENNIYWSNKEAITIKDVVATYNILKTTNTNPVMQSLLKDVTIEEKTNSVVFKIDRSSVNSLNIFFQPILNEKLINSLSVDELAGNFTPKSDSLYSWKFRISSIKTDSNLWINDLILEKNENFHNNNTYIDKYDIKFFKNNNFLINNKDLINIFNDDKNIIWKSVPRLESHYYFSPKYTALFLNIDTIKSKKLRNFILYKIDKSQIVKLLWEGKFSAVKNPYLSDYDFDKDAENKNIEWMMEYISYYKKSKLAKLLTNSKTTQTSNSSNTSTNEPKQSTWSINSNYKDVEDVEKNINKDLEYIISWLDKKYNFVSKDNILLKWNTQWHKPDAIYINDYKLKWYDAWSSVFYYRLKVGDWYDSIKEWKNEYKIIFEENWEKTQKEDLTVFYYTDTDKLEEEKNKFYSWFIKISTWTSNTWSIEVPKETKENTTSTIDKELKEKLDSIEDDYYYNKDFERYTLKLMYIDWEQDMINTVSYITKVLWEQWIMVQPIAVKLSDLSKVIAESDEKNSYDMFLAWINLWFFDFNIYPYFHSSQVKSGYNFSNLKKLSLDIILEEINANKIHKDWLESEQKKALDLIKEEQVVKVLYTPARNLLIDKNIKNVKFPTTSTWNISRTDYLSEIYLSAKSHINSENKWFIDFMKYIYNILTW